MNTQIDEVWRKLNLEGFKYLYEISSNGKVRYKPYKFFKNGKLELSKGRELKIEDGRDVFLTNRRYQGLYNTSILYRHSYPNNNL
jgi:hypothetical protein